jgi:hypothetical protein
MRRNGNPVCAAPYPPRTTRYFICSSRISSNIGSLKTSGRDSHECPTTKRCGTLHSRRRTRRTPRPSKQRFPTSGQHSGSFRLIGIGQIMIFHGTSFLRMSRMRLRVPRMLLQSGGQSGTRILRDTICFRCSARADKLLVAQCFDGIEARGFVGRPDTKEQADCNGNYDAHNGGPQRHGGW